MLFVAFPKYIIITLVTESISEVFFIVEAEKNLQLSLSLLLRLMTNLDVILARL